jgi:hypothetical protein
LVFRLAEKPIVAGILKEDDHAPFAVIAINVSLKRAPN